MRRRGALFLALACLLSAPVFSVAAPQTSRAVPVINEKFSDWVNAAAFHTSGQWLAVGVMGQINNVTCPAGQSLENRSGHSKYVQGLAYSPDGDRLYSIGWDGILCNWQLDSQGRLYTSPPKKVQLGSKKPQCLAVFPDGTRVAVGGPNNSVELYDSITLVKTGSLTGLKSTATSLVVDPARNRLVAGDKNGNLAIWSTVDSKLIKKWGGHGKKVTGLIVDRTTGDIISGDAKGELKRWDPDTYKNTRKVNFKDPIRGLQVSPDGRFIYLALKSGEIRLLNRELTDAVGALSVAGRPNSLAIDQRGRYLACGTDQNLLYVWDLLGIREIKIAYDIPAKLEITVAFDDAGALIPNRALDGGEKVTLSCRVKNIGEGTAYDTQLNVDCDNTDISHPTNIKLGDILAGAEKIVPVSLEVALEAKDGKATFNLHVSEKKKNDARNALRVSVRHLPKPNLAITMIQLDDLNSGSTSGNGNGIPENDETVEAEIFLKNTGEGPAWRNQLVMTDHTAGVTALIDNVELAPIPAGGSASGRVRFHIPKTFDGTSLAISVQVSDAITGIHTEADKTWQAKQNVPVLVADWQVVQTLRNGRLDKPGKLQLLIKNTGTLDAENIRIKITNDQGLEIGHIPPALSRLIPGTSGYEVPFEVSVPKFFKIDQVAFQAVITQDSFQGVTARQTFDIDLSRPDLVVQGLPAELTLTRGENLFLDLSLANQGGLDAEGVQVVVSAPDLGLHEVIDLDKVASRGRRSLSRISWPVPTGLETGSIDVSVEVTQEYFASVRKTFRPVVVSEEIAQMDIQATIPSGGLLAGAGSAGGSGGRPQHGLDLKFGNFKSTIQDPHYKLEILAEAPQGIRDIRAYVNGKQIYRLANQPEDLDTLHKMGGRFLSTEIQLNHLKSGDSNDLRVEITGEDNTTQRFEKTIRFQRLDFAVVSGLDLNIDVNTPPRSGRDNPKAAALLIGVSEYRNRGCSIPPVEFAEQDVLAVKQTLINTLGYREDRIIVLLDENATKGDIEDALTWGLPNLVEAGESDVFVYYCGHGAPGPDNKNGYLVPYDGNPAPQRILRYGINLQEFQSYLGDIDARSMTVAIDACFSGISEAGDLVDDISPVGVSIEGPTGGRDNWVIFSASGGSQVSSWYRAQKHGLFTYFFLKGIQGEAAGDQDRRGKIQVTAGQLEKYLVSHVGRVAKMRDIIQTPQLHGRPDRIVTGRN